MFGTFISLHLAGLHESEFWADFGNCHWKQLDSIRPGANPANNFRHSL